MELAALLLYSVFIFGIIAHYYFKTKVKVVPPIMNAFISNQFAQCSSVESVDIAAKYCDILSEVLWGWPVVMKK